jgi:hypothetical protein
MNAKEEGRVCSAAHVRPEPEDRTAADGCVNGKNGVNSSNGHNGTQVSLVHLARNSHLTRCGLDRRFFGGAIVTSKVGETTCQNCRRAHSTLTLIKQRARKWEREHAQKTPRSVTVHRPANGQRPGELVQVRWAFEEAERKAARRGA